MWQRAAAKMALATLSLSLPDDWLDTPDAERLLRWLWEEKPKNDDGSLAFTYPGAPEEVETLFATPPSNVITQMEMRDGRDLLSFSLMGSLYVRIAVDAGQPAPDTCWVMPPSAAPRGLKWMDLMGEATLTYIERNPPE